MPAPLSPSELIVNPDGSIYHLNLRPEQIAPTVILVGDMGRVARISRHFDHIEHIVQRREFLTHTGTCGGIPVSVLSTGIGTDNIDIVINELDAAVNIDLRTREIRAHRKSLNLIRIGTSGALQPDIPVGTPVVSEYGLGFDGLLYYYDFDYSQDELETMRAFGEQVKWPEALAKPYLVRCAPELMSVIGRDMPSGITATATGFYGPQGRRLYLTPRDTTLNQQLTDFRHGRLRVMNYEMETSALYGLGRLMGHRCLTCCAVIANRIRQEYSQDPKVVVDQLIEVVLDRLKDLH
ncbi:MAG: nucleoside phosphorylase [Saprospiraceae bacterium]|nr:nucleoside phosphorylase [Saprospiraceae bacterium]